MSAETTSSCFDPAEQLPTEMFSDRCQGIYITQEYYAQFARLLMNHERQLHEDPLGTHAPSPDLSTEFKTEIKINTAILAERAARDTYNKLAGVPELEIIQDDYELDGAIALTPSDVEHMTEMLLKDSADCLVNEIENFKTPGGAVQGSLAREKYDFAMELLMRCRSSEYGRKGLVYETTPQAKSSRPKGKWLFAPST